MEFDSLVRQQQRPVARRVLSFVAAVAAVSTFGGLGWALADPRGGGAMLAFCSFVIYLVARALKWST